MAIVVSANMAHSPIRRRRSSPSRCAATAAVKMIEVCREPKAAMP